jgi:hypothetical protein
VIVRESIRVDGEPSHDGGGPAGVQMLKDSLRGLPERAASLELNDNARETKKAKYESTQATAAEPAERVPLHAQPKERRGVYGA